LNRPSGGVRNVMKKFFQKINNVLAQLSGVSLAFIMVFLLIDIISRTISRPVLGASEMAIFSMLVAIYLGIPYCEQRKDNVRVEALLVILPGNYRKTLEVLSKFIVFITAGIILYSLGIFTLQTFKAKTAIAGPVPFRIFPVLFVMSISILFFLVQTFVNLIDEIVVSYKKDNNIQNNAEIENIE